MKDTQNTLGHISWLDPNPNSVRTVGRLGLTGTINSNGIRYHTSEGHEVLNAFVDGEDYIIRLPLL